MKNIYFYSDLNENSLYHFEDDEPDYMDYFKDIFESKIDLFSVDFIKIKINVYMDNKIEISNNISIENYDILQGDEILIDAEGDFIFSFPCFNGKCRTLNLIELRLYEDDITYYENKNILSIEFKLELN